MSVLFSIHSLELDLACKHLTRYYLRGSRSWVRFAYFKNTGYMRALELSEMNRRLRC